MTSFEIVFYKTSNNICPVKVFLLDTDIKMRAKISSLMEILEEYGNFYGNHTVNTYVTVFLN